MRRGSHSRALAYYNVVACYGILAGAEVEGGGRRGGVADSEAPRPFGLLSFLILFFFIRFDRGPEVPLQKSFPLNVALPSSSLRPGRKDYG